MADAERKVPLRAGEAVPEFSAAATDGTTFSRGDLLGKLTVLYFYPKAGSAGCSMEAREFSRRLPEFSAAGAHVVGVSVDPVGDQRDFQKECELGFPLLADPDRRVSRSFGVLGLLGTARRVTFVIGPDGAVRDVVDSWRPGLHVREALRRLPAKGDAAPPPNPSAP